MSTFLDLNGDQRRNAITITADRRGTVPVSVEKDYVVCAALRELFSLPDACDHLTFKGGTSLSKAFSLIERFSEDVDIVVSRELIGADSEPSNLAGLSRSAKAAYVRSVQQSLERWIRNVAIPYFSNAPALGNGSPLWSCRIDDSTQHRDTVLLEYVSVLETQAPAYIRPSVKLEFGARADRWPSETRAVQSYVAEVLSDSLSDAPVSVEALTPERTFLEKLCLAAEDVAREFRGTPRPAQSRHFYDLHCLIKAGVGDRAVRNRDLHDRVVQHREMFYYRKGIDYDSMRSFELSVVPNESQLKLWKLDYDQLKENMLFGERPEFEDVIASVESFMSEIRG